MILFFLQNQINFIEKKNKTSMNKQTSKPKSAKSKNQSSEILQTSIHSTQCNKSNHQNINASQPIPIPILNSSKNCIQSPKKLPNQHLGEEQVSSR